MSKSSFASDEPITADTLTAMSRQLLAGKQPSSDVDAVATLLNGLEQDMSAFHRAELGESEPVTVYSPAPG
jgi:hypothetical protein